VHVSRGTPRARRELPVGTQDGMCSDAQRWQAPSNTAGNQARGSVAVGAGREVQKAETEQKKQKQPPSGARVRRVPTVE